jgi:pimeloyl-ACP methyl ester carboxylesterase
MGGLIAQQLALSAPKRVRSLALLCTFSRGKDATKLSPFMFWVGLRTRIGTRRQRRHAFLQIVLPPAMHATTDLDALAEQFTPVFGHDLADHSPVEMKQLSAMSRCDVTPRLGELSGIPTLVVSAEHDPIASPASGRIMAHGIRSARFVEIAGASHGIPVYEPTRINTLLLEHLAGVESGAPA